MEELTNEQFAALLDDLIACQGHMIGRYGYDPVPKYRAARTAVLDAYAQSLDSAGQLRAERNDLQSKLNHMTDDRDSYAQARAGGAVKVPEPVAWVIPGDGHARDGGWLDAMAWSEGEFTKPLYAHPPAEAATDETRLRNAVKLAYGHLWNVNEEPAAPIPIRTNEAASIAARHALRDVLTMDERGEAIKIVRAALSGRKEGNVNEPR